MARLRQNLLRTRLGVAVQICANVSFFGVVLLWCVFLFGMLGDRYRFVSTKSEREWRQRKTKRRERTNKETQLEQEKKRQRRNTLCSDMVFIQYAFGLHFQNSFQLSNFHCCAIRLLVAFYWESLFSFHSCMCVLKEFEIFVFRTLVAPCCAIPRDYLSDTPLLRAMGFLVSQYGQLGATPPPPFLSVFPLGEHAKRRCDTPPKRVSQRYLRDTLWNKANGCDTPLCDTISKEYNTIARYEGYIALGR